MRYEPVTAPVEVNGLSDIPYGCDCNNLAPRFGFAYRLPEGWGVLRAAYGIHYGQIFPVTYGHARFNPPGNIRVVVSQPNLADPLGGRTFEDFDPDDRSSVFALSPDLVAPYSHQYNFSWDLALGDWVELQLGYVGSRSHKLFMLWFTNRAQVVPGIPQTTATVNDRRSDPSYFDIFHLINGSRGYYDAGRVSVALKNWKGLTLNGGYWFSKSIDTGTDYLNTLSSRGARKGRSQSEFGVQQDMKGLSNFDQPHSLLVQFSYDTPKLTTSRPASWLARAFVSWSFSSVVLAKSGTPFSIRSGSDGPGFGNVDGTGGDRPHVIDPALLGRTIGNPDTSRDLLPVSAFRFIDPTEPGGNVGRNTFRKGRIANVNAALSKSWRLSSEKSFTFRAESVNFLNTPQSAEPSTQLTSPAFGQITNTLNDGRAFRFHLRFDF